MMIINKTTKCKICVLKRIYDNIFKELIRKIFVTKLKKIFSTLKIPIKSNYTIKSKLLLNKTIECENSHISGEGKKYKLWIQNQRLVVVVYLYMYIL